MVDTKMSFHRYAKLNSSTMHFYDDTLKPKEDWNCLTNCLTFSHNSGGYLNTCWGDGKLCTPITAEDLIELTKYLKKNSRITPEAKEYLKRMMIWWISQYT